MLTIEELLPNLKDGITYHEIAANQILFQQGEQTIAIYWVESGGLKLVSFTDERMIIHYCVGAGESFAETALYFDTYGCTAIAEQASRIIAVPKQIFLQRLRESPILWERYLMHLTHRFSSVKRLLELRSIRFARERLLHYLSYQLQPGELVVPLKQSLKSMAIELGLSPEVLSRTFTQLESENILSRKKGSVTFNSEWVNS